MSKKKMVNNNMNFKLFCENYEHPPKENILTQNELELLKNSGFKIAKDKKTAVKKLESDFMIDVFSDKTNTVMKLKLNNIQPEVEVTVSKNRYITPGILSAFLKYSEEKIKNFPK